MKLNLVVIYGSVRDSRQGIKAAKFIINKLKERKHLVSFVDPKEYKLPLLDKRFKDYPKRKAPESLKKLAKLYRKADAFVIVSGEYNHSIPPALSNILDYFYEEYFFRPSGIVSYSGGTFGGVRASMQLRAMLSELRMSSIPTIFPVPAVQDAFDENGKPADSKMDESIKKFIDELEWYAEALKEQRKKGLPY